MKARNVMREDGRKERRERARVGWREYGEGKHLHTGQDGNSYTYGEGKLINGGKKESGGSRKSCRHQQTGKD